MFITHDITVHFVWRFYLAYRLVDPGFSELGVSIAFDSTKGPELSVTAFKVIVAVGFDFYI